MKITSTLLTLLLFYVILLTGCSSETEKNLSNQQRWGGPADFPSDRQLQFNRTMNLTEEERQQRFEEMQQIATEACRDKNEGDACQLQGPMAGSEGICTLQEGQLVCAVDRPDRPLREQR